MSAAAGDEYQATGEGLERSTGPDTTQDDYVSRPGQKEDPVPVQSDNAPIDDPVDGETADSDEQLKKDDADAINEDNIIDERTRGAKPDGQYREPGDTEGLPSQ